MNIIKRNGNEVIFDKNKISNAISKANEEVEGKDKLSTDIIAQIADKIEKNCEHFGRALSVEEIQDMVEKELYDHHAYLLMKKYMLYRYKHQLNREMDDFDGKIISINDDNNEEVNQENANKNPTVNSTKRDYFAGEICKHVCEKYVFPEDLWNAHKLGIIHIHKQYCGHAA